METPLLENVEASYLSGTECNEDIMYVIMKPIWEMSDAKIFSDISLLVATGEELSS